MPTTRTKRTVAATISNPAGGSRAAEAPMMIAAAASGAAPRALLAIDIKGRLGVGAGGCLTRHYDAGMMRRGAGSDGARQVQLWSANFAPEPTGIAPVSTVLADELV